MEEEIEECPCDCGQCQELWDSGPEGKEFVKALYKLETEDR